jgi:hypothetical protein
MIDTWHPGLNWEDIEYNEICVREAVDARSYGVTSMASGETGTHVCQGIEARKIFQWEVWL